MRKILTAAMAALTLGGAIAATAVPAQAEGRHGGGDWHGGGWRGGGRDGGDWGAGAAFAGIAGLALGAAIADNHHYGYRGYEDDGYYYGPAYGYGGPYGGAVCYGSSRVWDPYVGHYIIRRTSYYC